MWKPMYRWYCLLKISQKDVLSSDILSLRTFFPPDIFPAGRFVCWTFCPSGCFVPPDVLSLRTFCTAGRFVPTDVLSPDVLSLRTFCLRSFCPQRRFVSGHFVWTPLIHVKRINIELSRLLRCWWIREYKKSSKNFYVCLYVHVWYMQKNRTKYIMQVYPQQ